jgi:OFA family oxalate/formate antiporter-like MFS transporter
LILGVLYAWSVMGKALVIQWHWSSGRRVLPFTISAASFALMMIFAGRWQDKIGPRYVAMLGGIILGLGLIASSFATTPVMMLVTFGLVGGLGIGLGYSATTPPSIKWFPPAKRALSQASWSAAWVWPPSISRP